MAPSHIAVAVTPAVAVSPIVVPDAALIRRAAALLVRIQPQKKSKKVVCELRGQLRKERFERESHGLNHWSEHAPMFLAGIVRRARVDRLRRYEETAAFRAAKHVQLLSVARLIVGDCPAAEIVVAETYRELLTGSATIAGAFTALICNARNYLGADAYRLGRLVPLQEAFAPNFADADESDDEAGLSFEPVSCHREDGDPLDILIAREDEAEWLRMVAEAKRHPHWRFIKRKQWAAPLLENVPN